jgi:hypothetical protein
MKKIQLGEEFISEKTSDCFREVQFTYGKKIWKGALPIRLRYQGYEIDDPAFVDRLESFYEELNYKNRNNWIISANARWNNHSTQTYKVFEALFSGEWECRVCGPVPKVNPQAASRLRDIKKKNFVIASKRMYCEKCNGAKMHDVLVMIDLHIDIARPEFRKPISPKLKYRIYKVLGSEECVFNQVRTTNELIIDHKFPSQRWSKPESENTDKMTDLEIRNKFQLLSNQTNLLKSRECDRCLFKGIRGQFLGIRWYFKGSEKWEGKEGFEEGCVGCPWHDVALWKSKLKKMLGS